MADRQLDLSAFARRHFRIENRRLDDREKRVIGEAVHFAKKALDEYQRLEELALEELKSEYVSTREEVTATDLVRVVELYRSIRGRTTVAGDLWQALSYLLERNLAMADWALILDELEELARL